MAAEIAAGLRPAAQQTRKRDETAASGEGPEIVVPLSIKSG
jgi:hypothetical protein